uniref:HddA n=1 Tax=Spirochaeta aurantia TaxID=147 RepID=Q0PHZ3_SPIAU|nr:HddA [Spirochaeta aurantia]
MIISQTPLRVSFFGGGTDIAEFYQQHGGLVLSSTIDKFVYIIVKARYDDRIVLNYSEREVVDSVDDIRHNIFRETLRLVGITGGLEITSIADIPSQGSGLGSSSSFTVGLVNALYAFLGDQKGPREIAEIACRIEIEILKEPIGKQDQYAAAFGGFRSYRFLPTGEVEVKSLAVRDNEKLALEGVCRMFFTGITRKASAVLSDQLKNLSSREAELLAIKQIAETSAHVLERGDARGLGELLDQSWQEKRRISSKISSPEIDGIYSRAMEAGALRGKAPGCRGGGVLLLCSPQRSTLSVEGCHERTGPTTVLIHATWNQDPSERRRQCRAAGLAEAPSGASIALY